MVGRQNKVRDELEKGLYNLITKKTTFSDLDPNYMLIIELLEDFSDEDVKKFYKFYATNSDYFNEQGFTSMMLFQRALNSFKKDIKDSLLKVEKIEEKSISLFLKLSSIYEQVKGLYADEMEKRATALEERLDEFKNGDTGEKLFTEDEKSIIKNIGLFVSLDMIKNFSEYELKEKIRDNYISLVTRKYFYNKTSNNKSIGMEDRGSKEVVTSHKVISLLDGLATNSK